MLLKSLRRHFFIALGKILGVQIRIAPGTYVGAKPIDRNIYAADGWTVIGRKPK